MTDVIRVIEPVTTVVAVLEPFPTSPSAPNTAPATALSNDVGNALQRGSDGGLYLPAASFLQVHTPQW